MRKLYIDTHAHYTDKQFNNDRKELLNTLSNDFYALVEIGCDIKTSKLSLDLSDKYEFIYSTIGIHPSEVKNAKSDDLDFIRKNSKGRKVVAIGEIGLDYYWDKEDEIKNLQKKMFILQLQIAKEKKLPVVIHSREASKDTLYIIKTYAADMKGIIHCYSYSYETAKEYVKMGYYIGIGGVVTYNNAKKLQETVEKIPLEHLVLETDAPYLAPVPNRGKRNSSLNLKYVVTKIAELKGVSEQEVLEKTFKNAREVYNI